MKFKRKTTWCKIALASATILVANIGIVRAESHPVCKLISKEKRAAAFLLDPNDKVSNGPINFGRYAYQNSDSGRLVIPTGYKLVVAPKRLKITNCRAGCLVLKEISPTCNNAKTYAADYVIEDRSSPSDRSWLPWKQEQNVGIFEVDDPEASYDTVIDYKFNTRIFGEIYDPQQKR